MTPKEALEAIRKELQDRLEFPINLTPEYRLVSNALNELEELKKPPTVDEVCKALGEQLKQDINYGAKQFYYTIENTKCIMFVTETYGDGLWSINEYLPTHLITLIGRFYEGLK